MGRAGLLLLVTTLAATACGGSQPAERARSSESDGARTELPASSARASQRPAAPAPREAQSLAGCGQGPVFSVLPLATSDFRSFRPLGFPQPPQHIFGAKHSNFTINLPGEKPVSGLPVRFPSDATVTSIVSTESDQGSGYQLTFFPCREFKSYLFHLGEISPALESALGQSSPKCENFDFGAGGKIRKCTAETRLSVKAGEAAGASDPFAGVDWGGVDYRVTLPFANPTRYDGDFPHMVSPLEYATAEVRALVDRKIGTFDGQVLRTAPPITGSLMQDKVGTAQGNWFTHGSTFMNTQDFGPWLGLLHDHVHPETPIISMGTSVRGMQMGLYTFTPRTSGLNNRDFSEVRSDGAVYCYEGFALGRTASQLNLSTVAGVLLMTMPDPTTLKVELQPGKSCGAGRTMTESASVFER